MIGQYFILNSYINNFHGSIVQCTKPGHYKIIEKLFVFRGIPTPSRDLIPRNNRTEKYLADVAIRCMDKGSDSWTRGILIHVCSICYKQNCPTFTSLD